MRENWELYLGPEYVARPKKSGFQKGYTNYNKGKKWNEFMPKKQQKRILKALKKHQFKKGHPSLRPENAGKPKRKVVAVYDDGRFCVFPSVVKAGEMLGVYDSSVYKCCQRNQSRKMLYNSHGKPLNRVNTDYRCSGIRCYYEDDPIWMTKIRNI